MPHQNQTVRIENLTSGPIKLDIGRSAQVTIPPSSPITHFAGRAGRERDLTTDQGVVREVLLRRRSQTVTGLPPRQKGVVYLVPWLTAWAARHRPDLVFAADERRDSKGNAAGVRALGRFSSWWPNDWAPAVTRWRHPGWSWILGRERLITSGRALAALLLGAAVGGIVAVVPGRWSDTPTRDQVWLLSALGIVGLAVLAAAELMRRGRDGILRRRGTAYIVKEQSRDWTRDQAQGFLASAGRQFAATLWVPGPGELGGTWDWSLSDGPQHWDVKVAELVRSFQAVQFNHDPETPRAMFMWAWWPVAIAFGVQVKAAQRGLTLDVWQRPSYGRAGEIEPPDYSQKPHRFRHRDHVPRLADVLPDSMPEEFTWRGEITAAARPTMRAPVADGKFDGDGVTVLLVRLNTNPWGPIPAVPAHPDPAACVSLALDDAAGLGIEGTLPVEIRELRCVPPAGSEFPWHCYPSLVREVSDWLIGQRAGLADQTALLGTLLIPEVALGLGIEAGEGALSGWPGHLWPIVHGKVGGRDTLVVPRLDLGSSSLLNGARNA